MIQISLCSQIKNRINQFKETFYYNIDLVSKNENIEWIIVDAKSDDGLEEFIKENIQTDRLHFYQTIDDIPYGQPVYKNFSARLSSGSYLFNLDIDNFVDEDCFKFIPKLLCCLEFKKGTHGRIGMPRNIFKLVGGYDESFMPAGAHDIDLISRCISLGFKFVDARPKMPAIINTKEETIKYSHNPDNLSWQEMNYHNMKKLRSNIENKTINPNKEFKSCKFIHNFKEVVSLGKNF